MHRYVLFRFFSVLMELYRGQSNGGVASQYGSYPAMANCISSVCSTIFEAWRISNPIKDGVKRRTRSFRGGSACHLPPCIGSRTATKASPFAGSNKS